MFRIKICGVTNVSDAITAADAGADAIGLNFYEKSPRCISWDQAAEIAGAVRPSGDPARSPFQGVACIGVFVNQALLAIVRNGQRAKLTGFQLHGDESPDLVARLSQGEEWRPAEWCRVIRARRFDERGVSAIANDLKACCDAGRGPDAVLVDANSPGRYGGTGETVSWVGLADHRRWLGDTPLILAGGLTPDNVAEAIRIVRPYGVDVASGVESAPGKKDPAKVRDFIAAARAAFDSL